MVTPAQKSGFKRWARSMSLRLRSLEVIVTFKEDFIPSSSVWKLNISTSEENLACFDNFFGKNWQYWNGLFKNLPGFEHF